MFDSLAYHTVKIFAGFIQRMPVGFNFFLAGILGNLAYLLDKRRYVAYANLKAAFGTEWTPREIRAIIRKSYVHFAKTMMEILYFPKMDKAYIEKYIQMNNPEFYQEGVSGKKSTIFMMAHFGNWELAQIYSGILDKPLHIFARDQKHTRLNDFLNQLRAAHGAQTISTSRVRELMRAIREKRAIGALGDQGGGPDGVIAPLFGRKATFPRGLVSLAARMGASIVPAFMIRQNGPYQLIQVFPPLNLIQTGNQENDEIKNNQLFLNHLEKMVRQYPEQWLWQYKWWKFSRTKKVLILEDTKAGHAAQARAIGREFERLAKELPEGYEIKTEYVKVEFKNKLASILFFLDSFFFYPFAQSRLWIMKWYLKPSSFEKIKNVHADAVVACGSKLTPVALWLSRENLAKTVIVMKPSFPYQFAHFDLVILPKHDHAGNLKSHHIRTTVAPNLSDIDHLNHHRQKLADVLHLNGKSRLSIFIGGDSKSYKLEKSKMENWLNTLAELSRKKHMEFMITTSRRTGAGIDALVREKTAKNPNCKLMVIANEKNIEGITYGMLASSDVAVVTEDSVSMISEALSAGKRVIVLKAGNGQLPRKHREFQELLASEGLIEVATADDFSVKFETAQKHGANTNLIEAERKLIRDELRKILI